VIIFNLIKVEGVYFFHILMSGKNHNIITLPILSGQQAVVVFTASIMVRGFCVKSGSFRLEMLL